MTRGQEQSNYPSALSPPPRVWVLNLLGRIHLYRRPSHGSAEKERFSIRALSRAPCGVHTAARSRLLASIKAEALEGYGLQPIPQQHRKRAASAAEESRHSLPCHPERSAQRAESKDLLFPSFGARTWVPHLREAKVGSSLWRLNTKCRIRARLQPCRKAPRKHSGFSR
jgi:hypothetical protein